MATRPNFRKPKRSTTALAAAAGLAAAVVTGPAAAAAGPQHAESRVAAPAAVPAAVTTADGYLADRLNWINASSSNCLRATMVWTTGRADGNGDAVVGYVGEGPTGSDWNYARSPLAAYDNGVRGTSIGAASFTASADQRYSNRTITYYQEPNTFSSKSTDFAPQDANRFPTTVRVVFSFLGRPAHFEITAWGSTTAVPIIGANDGVLYGSASGMELTTVALAKASCPPPPPIH